MRLARNKMYIGWFLIVSILILLEGCNSGTSSSGNSSSMLENVSRAEITSFSINGVPGSINGWNISVKMPFGTDLASLRPKFITSGGARVYAGGYLQTSGLTSVDFTNPVLYSVRIGEGMGSYYNVVVVTNDPTYISCKAKDWGGGVFIGAKYSSLDIGGGKCRYSDGYSYNINVPNGYGLDYRGVNYNPRQPQNWNYTRNLNYRCSGDPQQCQFVLSAYGSCIWNCNNPSNGTNWCGSGHDSPPIQDTAYHCLTLAKLYITLFNCESFPNKCLTNGMETYGEGWNLCKDLSTDGGKTCPGVILPQEPTLGLK